ncbi:MAG: YqgE/AlgH family protein [Alphaproteobacteria bacterium]
MSGKGLLKSPPKNDLSGQLLVALPGMSDSRFKRAVIYICAHTSEGAMGITLNQRIGTLSYNDFLKQVGADISPRKTFFKKKKKRPEDIFLYFGGPVEATRGFILHSGEYKKDDTLMIGKKVGLTTSIDIVRDIARGKGPKEKLFALGYAGWSPGQLDREFEENSWLSVPADNDLIFNQDNKEKWAQAIQKIGINPTMLSSEMGHA